MRNGFRARTRVAEVGILTCDDRRHHGDDQSRHARQRWAHRTGIPSLSGRATNRPPTRGAPFAARVMEAAGEALLPPPPLRSTPLSARTPPLLQRRSSVPARVASGGSALTPQTTPTPHPSGTGAALTGTMSRARGSRFPMRGSSALLPTAHDPSGVQADHPLKLSPAEHLWITMSWGTGVNGPASVAGRDDAAVTPGPRCRACVDPREG